MDKICEPDDNFTFSKLKLIAPVAIPGGNHFIKLLHNNGSLYIRAPNCSLKSGVAKAGKRHYCDLVFTNHDDELIRWLEHLVAHCQKTIFTNRKEWFETEMEEHDIENSMTSPLKVYKSGRCYILRVNIPSVLGKTNMKIYDEQDNVIDAETLGETDNVATILEVQGIKCSPRNFQIDFEMKQMMVMKPVDLFEKCVFKMKPDTKLVSTPSLAEPVLEDEQPSLTEPVLEDEQPSLAEPVLEDEPPSLTEPVLEDEPPSTTTSTEDDEEAPELVETIVIPTNNVASELEEFELCLDEISPSETISLKDRKEVYYEMYAEARKKARVAKDIAIAAIMEAKRIKNTYMLDDIIDSSDSEESGEEGSDDEEDGESDEEEDETENNDE
jgi:hypothetical protein